jgi:two-component system sensor histidine kinase/response regulator
MVHILIVEDEPVNAEVALVICRGAGYKATVAIHGEDALLRLADTPFDLLLVDVQMPVMDGITLTKILRAAPNTAELPILGITAKSSAHEQTAMWEAGMSGIVLKPYRNQQLRLAISRLLGHPSKALV